MPRPVQGARPPRSRRSPLGTCACRWTWRVALILFSACVHALAFPPWNVTGVVWVCLVPFLIAIRDLTPGKAACAGWLWGTAAIWAVAYWVPHALTFYYQQPWWFGVLFCLVGSQILWGSYYAIFAACVSRVAPRGGGVARMLILSALWVASELGRARLLTGEPWMLLGYALAPNLTLIQAADLGGVYLLSFVVILTNASLAELVTTRNGLLSALRILMPPATALVALHAYGASRLAVPLPESPAVPIAVIQGNNDPGTRWQTDLHGRGVDRYLRMSREAAAATHPRVIVWPESAVTFFLARDPIFRASIARMLSSTSADLIVGSPHYEDADPARPQYFNSAFYITSDGRLDGRYDKAHLLPFGEYFPLKALDFLRRRFERARTFTAGDGDSLLRTRMGRAAVVICFEAIFPELVRRQMLRGADVLVNLSNDVWLGRNAGPEQHLSMVTLRAVENRTWVIRATTTGISAIIDPRGRVRVRSRTFEPAILDGNIVPMRVNTVYKRFGDVFAYGCLIAGVGTLLVRRWRGRRFLVAPDQLR